MVKMNGMLRKLRKNQKGFTLIELIVVIAILGILAAIAVPRLSGFQQSAKEAADEAAASTIASSAKMWIASNDSATAPTLATLEGESLVETGIEFTSTAYLSDNADIAITYDAATGVVTVTGDGVTVFTD